jgi:hypothetical protein
MLVPCDLAVRRKCIFKNEHALFMVGINRNFITSLEIDHSINRQKSLVVHARQ